VHHVSFRLPNRIDLILDRNHRVVGAGSRNAPADDISPGPLTSGRRAGIIIHPVHHIATHLPTFMGGLAR
jgi:hypothetical protein